MKKPILIVERIRHNGNIIIKNHNNEKEIFVGYSMRDTMRLYRTKHNLIN